MNLVLRKLMVYCQKIVHSANVRQSLPKYLSSAGKPQSESAKYHPKPRSFCTFSRTVIHASPKFSPHDAKRSHACKIPARRFAVDAPVEAENRRAHFMRLGSRSLLLVSGKDSAAYLQGLITNDIHLLDASDEGGPQSIYAMLLNTQGRVVYDVIICKFDSDAYLIEHDTALQQNLLRHLKMYKLRKDVNVDAGVKFDVYVCLEDDAIDAETMSKISHEIIHFPDPRLNILGRRFYVRNSSSENWAESRKNFITTDEGRYRKFRYINGIAEGKTDLPPGECFPLESNLDYLSGVHFHKGCYLGQELTARTQHTGVVRKRIMPIVIDGVEENQSDVLAPGSGIATEHNGKVVSVGKLRAHIGSDGLAVLRISEALAAHKLDMTCDGQVHEVRALKPDWWPEPD
ncbi:putative transferase CAF17 homolog, mitochondrial [Paramacrobiotus metropolitanus]|uniref:putative transferase CAF17 homolog, mitochondrial n=1 Tax=Paramacrobiotus metropolitanus TaxID=2943436 RepID=UPI0024464D64|nr:putative transferase CAF17 homolog, mitochondrial [Paramacrobiotus metropolitanus]